MAKENITNDVISMIRDWSEVFDLPIKDTKEFPGMERVGLSMDLINEEFMETLEAIDNRDITEVQDGLGDLLWVTVRAMMEFGIDPLETIQKIYESNMSKADVTMDDAIRTYKHYMEKGIQTYSKDKKGLFITYRTSDNKVLKSHKFKAPELNTEDNSAFCGSCGAIGTIVSLDILKEKTGQCANGHCVVGDIMVNSQLPPNKRRK